MSKKLREYCYTKDYKFYHNDGKTFTPITRKEYKKKTGKSDYLIRKLRNSLYPIQHTNYFFLKVPAYNRFEKKIKDKIAYAPVDWKLINLIKYFMKNNFRITNSDQGDFYSIGNIYFKPDPKLIPFLIEIFGEENIIQVENTFDFNKIKFKSTKWYKYPEWNNKIIIMKDTSIFKSGGKSYFTVLQFHRGMIKFMYKKLDLKFPDRSKAHVGLRIPNCITKKEIWTLNK